MSSDWCSQAGQKHQHESPWETFLISSSVPCVSTAPFVWRDMTACNPFCLPHSATNQTVHFKLSQTAFTCCPASFALFSTDRFECWPRRTLWRKVIGLKGFLLDLLGLLLLFTQSLSLASSLSLSFYPNGHGRWRPTESLGSALKFLPSKRQVFLTSVVKCLLLWECWVPVIFS